MQEPPPPLESQQAGPPAATMPLLSRLMNILAAPSDVFDVVKNSTAAISNWLTPAALLVIVSWIGACLIFAQPALQHQLNEIAEKNIQKQIEKSHLSGDEAERARQKGAEYAAMFSKVGMFAAPVFMGIITPVWWALIAWLVGSKVFKGNFSYIKALEVTGLANIIGVLESVVKTLLIFVTGSVFASPGLSLLIKEIDPQNPVHALLLQENAMTFWFLLVVAVGLARLCMVSFGRAIMWILGTSAVCAAIRFGLAFGTQAAFSK